MRPLRLLLAFVGGSWLYYVAVILIGGYLAAVSIPKGYFTFFGAEHNEIALALLSLFSWAVPVGGLVCAGSLALHRLLFPEPGSPALWLAASGMVASFLFFAMAPAARDLSQSFMFPWWAAPSFLAPWAGVAFAMWLASSRRVTLRRA